MRLLGITDLHGNQRTLERILAEGGPVDAVLLGGDITHFGSPEGVEESVRLAGASGGTVLAVAGNCDSAKIDQRLVELGVSLDGRGVQLGALGVHGVSAVPPWIPKMYQSTEEELGAALEAGYAEVARAADHCVLAHVPPRGLRVDRVFFGRHVGSRALSAFVERREPALVVCGHIHEGRGIERVGRTTVVNCGYGAKGHYALVEVDQEVRVELRRV
jgi:Icc-related predicted phosphoesterase